MIRIFVSPSQLCTLYMILYARKTHKEGMKDVLILDWPDKKKSLVKVITDTQKIYNWHNIINVSHTISDETDLLPSHKKKFTRKIKGIFFIKPVYGFLLKRYRAKCAKIEEQTISEKLAEAGEVLEVNIVTQTGITDSLFKLFPKAAVNYF